MFVNPNPFHYAEQIDRCALLNITQQLRHSYLSHLSHARSLYYLTTTQTTFTALSAQVLSRPGGFSPLYSVKLLNYLMMAVHLTPFTTASESSQNLRTRMFKF